MSEKERATRYTYEIYDIYIKDIPEKIKRGYFAHTLLSKPIFEGGIYGAVGYELPKEFSKQQEIYAKDIKELLKRAQKNEYVLFDDEDRTFSRPNLLIHKKIQYNRYIVGEMNVGFQLYENVPCPQMYWIECAFLNGEDRLSFIKLYCYDVLLDMVNYLSDFFLEVNYLNNRVFKSQEAQEQFRSHIENRSKRLPAWMREFLDYYDKLYISLQNLFDMKLPLNTTVFYTQANLNIRD